MLVGDKGNENYGAMGPGCRLCGILVKKSMLTPDLFISGYLEDI